VSERGEDQKLVDADDEKNIPSSRESLLLYIVKKGYSTTIKSLANIYYIVAKILSAQNMPPWRVAAHSHDDASLTSDTRHIQYFQLL